MLHYSNHTNFSRENFFTRSIHTHTHVMGTGGGGGSTTSEEKISVSVRVRPLNEAEKDLGCAWRHAEDAIVLDNSRKVRFFIIPPSKFLLVFLYLSSINISLMPRSRCGTLILTLSSLVIIVHRKPPPLPKNPWCTASITSLTNPVPIWTSTTRQLRK